MTLDLFTDLHGAMEKFTMVSGCMAKCLEKDRKFKSMAACLTVHLIAESCMVGETKHLLKVINLKGSLKTIVDMVMENIPGLMGRDTVAYGLEMMPMVWVRWCGANMHVQVINLIPWLKQWRFSAYEFFRLTTEGN